MLLCVLCGQSTHNPLHMSDRRWIGVVGMFISFLCKVLSIITCSSNLQKGRSFQYKGGREVLKLFIHWRMKHLFNQTQEFVLRRINHPFLRLNTPGFLCHIYVFEHPESSALCVCFMKIVQLAESGAFGSPNRTRPDRRCVWAGKNAGLSFQCIWSGHIMQTKSKHEQSDRIAFSSLNLQADTLKSIRTGETTSCACSCCPSSTPTDDLCSDPEWWQPDYQSQSDTPPASHPPRWQPPSQHGSNPSYARSHYPVCQGTTLQSDSRLEVILPRAGNLWPEPAHRPLLRNAQKHKESLRNTQKHTETHRNSQKHTETHRNTQKHTETHRNTQ